MDDTLFDVILGRIDGDASLAEGAEDLLLAACLGDRALADALGGEPPPRPARSAADDSATAAEPVGAFLASITLEGFRGVGAAQTLHLQPGPGLTVIAGRNGSGKSSFAEGLEVLLTGSTARFRTYKVFRDGWRNLHKPDPARLQAEFHVDGLPGTTVVKRTWTTDANLDDGARTVQVAGEKVTDLDRLGWESHLTAYSPFLAHSDLEAMFDGKPSELYDRLAAVLGLGDLTDTQDRLASHRLTLERAAREANNERQVIAQLARSIDDERAAELCELLSPKDPDLDAVVQLVMGGAEPATGGSLEVLRRLSGLAFPEPDAVRSARTRLQDAATELDKLSDTESARAQTLAGLLAQAVVWHDQHPDDTTCTVCGRGDALDDAWHAQAVAEIERLRALAQAADAAHAEAQAAVRSARDLIAPVPPSVRSGVPGDVGTADLAAAWTRWATPPDADAQTSGDLRAVAAHLALATDLAGLVDDVRTQAAGALSGREDRWTPVAERTAAWIEPARAGREARPTVADLKTAEKWSKAAHDDIRNDRLRPIADRAQETWQALRHESNVEFGPIRLAGSSTQRRVVLDATVDGSDGSALGVKSQGEVNALALSVFLPRATLADSPFRFVVIDDPVQAMDPAKVDGLARVLHDAAQTHQVVVFTHDDRLPSALRRLDLDARIIQVQRRPGSIVELVPAGDPVSRALGDARAVARDDKAPMQVKRRVVPGHCRLALESALDDITVRRELGAGRPHHEVDTLVDDAKTVHQKAALALFGDASAGQDVMPRLATIGPQHATTFKALKDGAHGDFTGHLSSLVKDTEALVDALQDAVA
jgi:energy-coupling factor transporter ATP-binding protein EcfA2